MKKFNRSIFRDCRRWYLRDNFRAKGFDGRLYVIYHCVISSQGRCPRHSPVDCDELPHEALRGQDPRRTVIMTQTIIYPALKAIIT